ncbi:hypothetical protein N7495_003830 [Penicillium taxi]|uniref:uncharacterized protein n=1 Tax=Penicillium taxi TaxID=168475 RepID=UPI00254594AC|nr:uncharacterized protein N7495_003830 [Penicillium taxi]KAJ5899086.1 hypothetical protein N7495_003830 [Penicillium taxi]
MASHEPDIFSLLPGPVLEITITQLDLASLHNLYRSSSTIFSLLHDDDGRTARKTIEMIVQLRVPDETQIVIRKFAFLRWAFASYRR